MKKSLTINARNSAGKKVSTSLGYINPNASNAIAGEFARRVNSLSTHTFSNAEIVKKMDTTEEEPGGSAKTEGVISYNADTNIFTYNGDATLYLVAVLENNDAKFAEVASGDNLLTLLENLEIGNIEAVYLFAPATANFTAAVLPIERR